MVSEEWKIFQDLRKTVIDKNPICSKCGCKEHLEVDHIVPDYCGGLTEISNLQTLCHMCHSKKTIDDRNKYIEVKIPPFQEMKKIIFDKDNISDVPKIAGIYFLFHKELKYVGMASNLYNRICWHK